MKACWRPLTNLDKVLIVSITQTFARCFVAGVAYNNHKIGVNP
jgi:hypothetical protein